MEEPRKQRVYRPTVLRGGLGCDALIGADRAIMASTIDLSEVSSPLMVEVLAYRAGSITDGIDTIVFTDVAKIILPDEMRAEIAPSLQAYRDLGLELCFASDADEHAPLIAAE